MRKLKPKEIKLIQLLLNHNQLRLQQFMAEQHNYIVEEINDGGMGSIRFMTDTIDEQKQKRILGKTIAEGQFTDGDQIPVMVYLNIDSLGNLFELDIWKVDFSPVKNGLEEHQQNLNLQEY